MSLELKNIYLEEKGELEGVTFWVVFIHLSIAAGRISGKELINIKVRKVGLQNFHQTLRS